MTSWPDPVDEAPLPPFDDSRKALVFALNAHTVKAPRPAMNKAMAAGMKKPKTKAQYKRDKKLREVMQAADPLALEAGEPDPLEGTRRTNADGDTRERARADWLGMDRASQAGLILKEFMKLDREHRVVLTGLLLRPTEPCDCRRPCCSGSAKVPRWVVAVDETCMLLKEAIDLVRVPGKKGLGTQPVLRRYIVEAHYMQRSDTFAELAAMSGVSPMTAAKHKALILEGLTRIEDEAWFQVDAMFDAAGITGTIIK